MKRATWLLIALFSAAANAATINMSDPRRAVGTDDGIRVDAALTSDFVSTGSPIGVTYQIQNFSPRAIGVVEKRCEASYDDDSRTVTLSVGSEIPDDGQMPRLVIIQPGEKRTLTTGARLIGRAKPRFVQIRINVLRDLAAFVSLIERQRNANTSVALDDAQFDEWVKTNDSIVLNVIPVRYRPPVVSRADASRQ